MHSLDLSNNPIAKELAELDIINLDNIELYYQKVRDRDDVAVLRCKKTGIIFLNRIDHIDLQHYNELEGTSYWNVESESAGLRDALKDDSRRVVEIKKIIEQNNLGNVSYLDVGCGLGGVMKGLDRIIKDIKAIEPQDDTRTALQSAGYNVSASIEELKEGETFDLVTLFHVFEHLTGPLSMLQKIYKVMKKDGTIVIEVPHARDVLLETFNLESFKKFTFWSEHIILHTQKSLLIYLEKAGFRDVQVKGIQRYPISNHLYWLWKGEPGGQSKLLDFCNNKLELEYENTLKALDQTDTLWVTARK